MFFGNIVTFGVVRMVGAKGSLFSVKELKMNQSRIPSDMWERPRGPEMSPTLAGGFFTTVIWEAQALLTFGVGLFSCCGGLFCALQGV